MRTECAVGIDIGTYQVKVAIAERSTPLEFPRLIGTGQAQSYGLQHGYINHHSDAIQSIKKAVQEAEQKAKVKINRAYVAIGGMGIDYVITVATVLPSRADNEITEIDIEKAIETAKNSIPQEKIINRKIIDKYIIGFRLDGQAPYTNNPVGLKASRLDVRVIFITVLEHHLNELSEALTAAGIDIERFVASPIAASYVALSHTERQLGCLLVNIGHATVTISIFENGDPRTIKVLPVGSGKITEDLALNLQVSLDDAEKIKLNRENLSDRNKQRKVEDIIRNRLIEIFELVAGHMKESRIPAHRLPGGIILTGGGTNITTIEDLSRATLQLPSRVYRNLETQKMKERERGENKEKIAQGQNIQVREANWAVAHGLCVMALSGDDFFDQTDLGVVATHTIKKVFRKIFWKFKKFLP
jgi:cell division protein FtsA